MGGALDESREGTGGGGGGGEGGEGEGGAGGGGPMKSCGLGLEVGKGVRGSHVGASATRAVEKTVNYVCV